MPTIETKTLNLKFNEAQLKEVQELFGKFNDIPDKVLSRTINDVLNGAKTDVSSAVREILNVKKSSLDKYIKVLRSSAVTLGGSIKVGGVLPARAFPFKQKPEGVEVKYYKDKPAEIIVSSFVAKLKNTTAKGVFRRETRFKTVGKQVKRKWKEMPQKWRYPIKPVYAPSHVTILASDPVWNGVQRSIEGRIDVALKREINYELNIRD